MIDEVFFGGRIVGRIYSSDEIEEECLGVNEVEDKTNMSFTISRDELYLIDDIVNAMPGVFKNRSDVILSAFRYYWHNVLAQFFEKEL